MTIARKTLLTSQITIEPLIDVLDNYGIRTGETLTRKKIHELGKVHRAVHLYLFDKSCNILLQRRSNKLDHFPGAWSISLTGHVNAGESSSSALRRELQEELNLDSHNMKVDFLFSYRQDAKIGTGYLDRQFNDIYVCSYDLKIENILYDQRDISEIKLVPIAKFKEMVADKNSELAPVYIREFTDVIYFLNSYHPPIDNK